MDDVDGDDSGSWYLVPVPGYGWDLVHGPTGRRLERDPQNGGLLLSADLNGLTHWDLLRPRSHTAVHRPHFWLPPFLGCPWESARDRRYPLLSDLQALVGARWTGAGGVPTGNQSVLNNVSDCVEQCETNRCNVMSYGNDGSCTLYSERNLEPAPDNPGAQEDPLGAAHENSSLRLERERRIFGDGAERAEEYNNGTNGTNPVYYRRRSETLEPVRTYRSCLQQLGPDADECERFLEHVRPDPSQALALQANVPGEVAGSKAIGICGIQTNGVPTEQDTLIGGALLRSEQCQRFCQSAKGRADGLCARRLNQYCASQTQPTAEEPSCSCWLSDATYTKFLEESHQNLDSAETTTKQGKLAERVNKLITQAQMKNYCWFTPCNSSKTSTGPPEGTCPATGEGGGPLSVPLPL